jgi:hypothetical protein
MLTQERTMPLSETPERTGTVYAATWSMLFTPRRTKNALSVWRESSNARRRSHEVSNHHCNSVRRWSDCVASVFDEGNGMTKEEALQEMMLLSALESWVFSQSARLPDYLVENIQRSLEVLERIVLEKP